MAGYFTLTGSTYDSALSELNAFDGALLAAGVGNTNLVKVSSVLPPEFSYVEPKELKLEWGMLLPIAYAVVTSSTPGTLITAAVAVGMEELGRGGVIVEYSAVGQTKDYARKKVQEMLAECFRVRSMTLRYGWTFAVDHVVENFGCAFACVPLQHKTDRLLGG